MDNLNHKSRSRVLALVLATSFALIVGRLYYLQVIRHQHYVGLASKEQVKKYEIPAKRGMIYARDREQLVPLTMNQEVYTVSLPKRRAGQTHAGLPIHCVAWLGVSS